MKGNILEAIIGAVVLVIASFFIFFAYTTSGNKISEGYVLNALFDDVGSLTVGADVKISGIKIGIVQSLILDKNFRAHAKLLIKNGVKIPSDSAANISTDGIIGNKFIAIVTGFEENMLSDGDNIETTKSAVNLESLIDKFVFGTKKEDK